MFPPASEFIYTKTIEQHRKTFFTEQHFSKETCNETFKAEFGKNLRNIQAETKNYLQKRVICDTNQSHLSEITLFLIEEPELNTMKKKII